MHQGKTIRASAPGRAGIVGNPTDGYGGSVLSTSIAQRAWCELQDAPVWKATVGDISTTISTREDLDLRGDHVDVVRAVLQRLWPVQPASINAGTSIPIRAGLSGSTAILASILAAVLTHKGEALSASETAEMLRGIEFDIMNVVCGFQDQYMVVFGGVNYMDFRGKEPGAPRPEPWATVEPVPFPSQGVALLLGHTGVERVSGSVHKGLRERWLERDSAVVDGYTRIAFLAREAKKAVLKHDWPRLGDLMNENHAIQRDLGGSGESNERLIAAAMKGGALGAKLAGAGGGGTIIALCLNEDSVRASLEAAGAERVWKVEPSSGLRVEQIEPDR